MKHVFVINPHAGKGKAVETATREIENYADIHPDFDYQIYVTRYPGDGQNFVKHLGDTTTEPVRIYACGGDGTLYEVANGAYGYKNIEIGAIPCGSGNDYIRLYGTPDQFQNIAAQVEGKSAVVDVIKCGNRIALNQCSMGFDAETCNKQQDFKKFKFLNANASYLASILYCFLFKMDNNFTISLDDNDSEKYHVLFCYVGNSRWYGSGFMAAPFAMPDDGLLDVVVVRKNNDPKLKLLKLIKPYKEGRLINHPITIFNRAKKVKIHSDMPATVNIDGECEKRTDVEFEIVPKAMRFIVPTSTTYFSDRESGKISNEIDFSKFKF